MKKLRVLGLDPGTANFGYCVTDFKGSKPVPVVAGKLQNTVTDMAEIVSHIDHFNDELSTLLEYAPNVVVVERFMNRGSFSGDTGEYVGVMVGLIAYLSRMRGAEVSVVQPGVWKTAFNRAVSDSKAKPTPLDRLYKFCLTEPHELDAYLMTLFARDKLAKATPFSSIRTIGRLNFVQALEAVATGKKRRMRKE